LVQLPATKISVDKDFNSFGLDSHSAMLLSGELRTLLNREVAPNLIYDYPTIALLANYLANGAQQKKTEKSREVEKDTDVAIIGMSCRFPGANNLDEYEQVLFQALNQIVDPEQLDASDPRTLNYRSGYLNNVDQFDASFFEISPKEAKSIDPQQRLLLELSYKTMQHAGYPAAKLKGSNTGVFIGISNFDYAPLTLKHEQHKSPYFGTGIALSIAANRLSYYYDFKGPSLAIDTACSSSLVATHQAIQSILKVTWRWPAE
jgi:acyl transferase domain-containing protein/acyl carrier protein